jgi:hypothetical protein
MELNMEITPESSSFERALINPGWYEAKIESETSLDRDRGEMLVVNYLLDEKIEYSETFCFYEEQSTARDAANNRMNKLGSACGLVKIGRTAELVGQNVRLKIMPRGEDGYQNVQAYARSEIGTRPPLVKGPNTGPWDAVVA